MLKVTVKSPEAETLQRQELCSPISVERKKPLSFRKHEENLTEVTEVFGDRL